MSTDKENPYISADYKKTVDPYIATADRLEPNLDMIDKGYAYASIAISLKRIADVFEFFRQQVINEMEKTK